MKGWQRLGLVVLLALLPAFSWADNAEGPIVRLNPDGSFEFRLPPEQHAQLRDVYRVLRDGLVIGECVVTEVDGNEGSATLRSQVKDGVKMSDTVVFTQHEDPLDYVGGDGWQRFTCEDGGFSARVPALRQVTSRRVAVGSDTVTVVEYVFVDDAERQAYEVMYFDLKPGEEPGKAAGEVLKAMAAQRSKKETHKVEIVGKHPVVVEGLAAEELDLHSELNGKPLRERARYYVVNGRLYELEVATIRPALSSRSYRFLNSFRPRGAEAQPQV